jgi:hypothetical protein
MFKIAACQWVLGVSECMWVSKCMWVSECLFLFVKKQIKMGSGDVGGV